MARRPNVIAIVDDDPGVRAAVQQLVQAHGYATELYSSAEEFISAAVATEATCLIVDIHLGDISGIELGRHLAAFGFNFPIVFMTASDDDADRRKATDFGCAGYLKKPFQREELMEAIEFAMVCNLPPGPSH